LLARALWSALSAALILFGPCAERINPKIGVAWGRCANPVGFLRLAKIASLLLSFDYVSRKVEDANFSAV
jgi:hypothetical protein